MQYRVWYAIYTRTVRMGNGGECSSTAQGRALTEIAETHQDGRLKHGCPSAGCTCASSAAGVQEQRCLWAAANITQQSTNRPASTRGEGGGGALRLASTGRAEDWRRDARERVASWSRADHKPPYDEFCLGALAGPSFRTPPSPWYADG